MSASHHPNTNINLCSQVPICSNLHYPWKVWPEVLQDRQVPYCSLQWKGLFSHHLPPYAPTLRWSSHCMILYNKSRSPIQVRIQCPQCFQQEASSWPCPQSASIVSLDLIISAMCITEYYLRNPWSRVFKNISLMLRLRLQHSQVTCIYAKGEGDPWRSFTNFDTKTNAGDRY